MIGTPLHKVTTAGDAYSTNDIIRLFPSVSGRDTDSRTSLHIASQHGDVDAIRNLIRLGADIGDRDNDDRTPLHLAAMNGHVDAIRELHLSSVRFLLHLASMNGRVDANRELVIPGGDVRDRDIANRTPLHLASMNGHVDAILELKTLGADIKAVADNGSTPLHLASMNGHVDAILELKTLGADIKAVTDDGSTPLHLASSYGHVDAIALLGELGADIEAGDTDGQTPLHDASREGHVDAIALLGELGADIEAGDTYGQTPLHRASLGGHIDAIAVLRELGADINARDDMNARAASGDTPLHYASARGLDEAIIQLIRFDADIEATNIRGLTPLQYASICGELGAFKQLVRHGANIEVRCISEEETPLHKAASYGHTDIIKELIRLGDNIEAINKDEKTPLHCAVKFGTVAAVKELTNLNANTEARDSNGRTCIIQAAISGKPDIVLALIEGGVRINATDVRSITALTHATRGVSRRRPAETIGHWRSAKILAEHKANGDEGYNRFPSLLRIRMGDDAKIYEELSKKLHGSIYSHEEVARLVTKGADIDSKYAGHTPLTRACSNNLLETVKVMVNAGASMEKKDSDGYTPIIVASLHGYTAIVKFLLQKGADISSRSDSSPRSMFWGRSNVGKNSLMLASLNGHAETAEVLVDGGLDSDDIDSDGNTSVHMAVVQGNIELVQLLINKGARVNVKNRRGISPLMMARSLGKIDAAEALESGGAVIDNLSLTIGNRVRNLFSVVDSPNLNNTFSNTDMWKSTISRTGVTGVCGHIDSILLKDGRCLQLTTREARRVMMRVLNTPVDHSRVVLPIQSSGTCSFFSTTAILFVSDMTRQNTKPFRRAMIMGRKKVGGDKFLSSHIKLFLKYNVMIQTILDGHAKPTKKDLTLPIINNEDVAFGLYEHGVSDRGLNCGNAPYRLPRDLSTTLTSMYAPERIIGFLDEDSLIWVDLFKKGMRIKRNICGCEYVADAVSITENEHVLSGLTLGGERVIYDSNIGIIQIDWGSFFENPAKIFEVLSREYSFATSSVVIYYNYLPTYGTIPPPSFL